VNKKEVESKEVEHVFGNTEVDHVELIHLTITLSRGSVGRG
jgi:hypothetical protein